MVRCQASGVDCWCRTGGRPRRGCQRLRTGDAGAAPRLPRADGPGPFPAAGGLHGCIGLSGHSVTIADRLKSLGHVALAVDRQSRGPTGLPTVQPLILTPKPRVPGEADSVCAVDAELRTVTPPGPEQGVHHSPVDRAPEAQAQQKSRCAGKRILVRYREIRHSQN